MINERPQADDPISATEKGGKAFAAVKVIDIIAQMSPLKPRIE
jgi:hypothetical protein